MILFEDFVLRAALAGLGVALIAGPLGCFVVWRRMAYFGDTMSHAALLGVALGLAVGVAPMAGVVALGAVLALFLSLLGRETHYGSDTLLGIFSHTALALGLVALGLMESVRVDLLGLLFGDILAVSNTEVVSILIGAALILAVLAFLWRPLLAITVNAELARIEGVRVLWVDFAYMILIALTVATAMRMVGVLLITALLVIPAAAARPFAKTPERMAVLAAVAGCLAVVCGLTASVYLDTPTGPSVVVSASVLFGLGLIFSKK